MTTEVGMHRLHCTDGPLAGHRVGGPPVPAARGSPAGG